jgi:hypothetical protein
MIKRLLQFVLLCLTAGTIQAAPVLVEDFDDPILEGWAALNNSTPGGSTSWFLGNPAIFAAHQGADESYAAANFEAAGLGGDIDLWLFTPVLDFSGPGSLQLSFFTRANGALPDRLEIYASGAGDSTVFGDYTLLLSINPMLGTDYPTDWTQFEAIFASAGSGRFAFRYFVTDTFVNGDYIGLDTIRVNRVPEPATLALLALALMILSVARPRRGQVGR